ncbi:MAG TPA: FecR domain-containing protein, partial [Vicinamibacteria bacterium]|nr:FecR domain-containing protein [Vicinamibacteria bacterium]
MSGDYPWDGSGEPDPEIQGLEATLRPLRGTRKGPWLAPRERRAGPSPGRWRALAAAAAVLLALTAVVARGRRASPAAGWDLAWLEGATWAQARVVREVHLGVGEWIDTGNGRARLSVGEIGEVQLEPATRIGLVDAGDRSHRLALSHGVLHASIWAPPGQFLVDTPSAVAVDLGCRYTLDVAEDGSGLLRVQAGWVGFESRGLQSLVPAG